MLGSLIPSSRFLVNRLLDQVDWSRAGTIVEYGPGVGTFTGEILRRLRPDANLVAIDTNRDFARHLARTLRDDRLHVIEGSAADAHENLQERGLGRADYVISGIPYSTMDPELRARILRTTHELLQQDGAFLVYQFTRAVLPYLARYSLTSSRSSSRATSCPPGCSIVGAAPTVAPTGGASPVPGPAPPRIVSD